MARRIEDGAVRYPFSFVFCGDSGAWPDPTADGIFQQLIGQIDELDPAPVFFAHLGDFAGPGTPERHEQYLELVKPLSMPNICVLGNHDVDDSSGLSTFEGVHGPPNFTFSHGNTRFVVIASVPGEAGKIDIPSEGPLAGWGPRQDDLSFLADALEEADEPNKVLLMHMPPHLGGRFAPHEEWGFTRLEDEFLEMLRGHGVKLVCSAHGLAFDTAVMAGTRFVMSGGGGTGLCSHFRGVCTEGEGQPEDRGALFHFVQVMVDEVGTTSGRVIQAFAPVNSAPRFEFGPH